MHRETEQLVYARRNCENYSNGWADTLQHSVSIKDVGLVLVRSQTDPRQRERGGQSPRPLVVDCISLTTHPWDNTINQTSASNRVQDCNGETFSRP